MEGVVLEQHHINFGFVRCSFSSRFFRCTPNRISSHLVPASTSTQGGGQHSRCTKPPGRIPGRASTTRGPSALRPGSLRVRRAELWNHVSFSICLSVHVSLAYFATHAFACVWKCGVIGPSSPVNQNDLTTTVLAHRR